MWTSCSRFWNACVVRRLGRDVDEFELAIEQLVADGSSLIRRQGGVVGGGGDAGLFQRLDPVAHQGDERRDDDGDAGAAESVGTGR